jgi:hypothetical protein
MQNVSNDFKNQIVQPKTIDAKIIIGQNEITSDDINNIKRTWNSSLFKTITKMVDIDTNTPIDKDTIIEPQFGLHIDDSFEYVSLGKYKVHDEPTLNKDTNSYQTIAYDKIVESMINYELLDTEITYPCTVRELFIAIFTKLNWNTSGIPISFVNSSSIIQEDVFSKTNMTYRDVLDELCTISCMFLVDKGNPTLIDSTKTNYYYVNYNDDSLYYNNNRIRYKNNIYIDEEYMCDTSVEIKNEVFFNSLVFSRVNDSDNIFRKDDEDIEQNGLHEFKVKDLQILSSTWRDNFIDEMWNYIKEFKYYAFDVNTNGITYLEPIDGFYLSTFGDVYPTLLLNDDLSIGNGLNEKIYSKEPIETTTEYKYADTTDRKINQAYIIVDKQNAQIQQLTQTTSNISSTEQTHYQDMLSKMDDKASISDLTTVTNQVNTLQTDTYTKTEIGKILDGTDENGVKVSFLQTLSATLDENGMSYDKTGAKTSSNINQSGVTVTDKNTTSELLFAGYDEQQQQALVRVANLFLTRFLGIDDWRLEIVNDSTNGKGLGFFYIG